MFHGFNERVSLSTEAQLACRALNLVKRFRQANADSFISEETVVCSKFGNREL
jgi:hypothetical protein